MIVQKGHHHLRVHCRTGSLEKQGSHVYLRQLVHCRTGSLEMLVAIPDQLQAGVIKSVREFPIN